MAAAQEKSLAARTVAGCLYMVFENGTGINDWRTASRDSAGIAPLPAETPEAVVQVYAARTFNWRGTFAVHTWVAVKEKTLQNIRHIRLSAGSSAGKEQLFPSARIFRTDTGMAQNRN